MALNFPNSPSLNDVYVDPISGLRFIYDGNAWVSLPQELTTLSDSPPSPAAPGDTWYDTSTGVFYIYYDDGSSTQWVSVVPLSALSAWSTSNNDVYYNDGNVGIGTSTPPVSLSVSTTDAILVPIGTDVERPTGTAGLFRYNTTSGTFEGYTTEWGPIGGGSPVTSSDTAPLTPSEGDLWFDQNDGTLNVYYNDGDSSQWVVTSGPPGVSIATGGNGDQVFWENEQTVTADYTITDGRNALSSGPITIDTGVTVTIGDGETWRIV